MSAKPVKYTEHEVTIKVRHYPNVMFLRQAVGNGEVEGHEVELSVNVAGSHPIIRFPKDEPMGAYTISWEDMINVIYPLMLQSKKEAKGV